MLNYAQCKLLVNDFYPVIEHCSEVLEIDPGIIFAHPSVSWIIFIPSSSLLDNVKALFRRARAHAGAWNPREAKQDFLKVAELDKGLEATCKNEIKKIEALERQKDKEDKDKLKNLF